ncbi:hypothetical protein MKW92_046630 [Papaver armeniacum]|nr:hypothetical protein MKW92_046630 [Papaver armeniacum]
MQGHPAVRPELDLVEQEDQLTHELSLEDTMDPETCLGNIFSRWIYNFWRMRRNMKPNILGDDQSSEEEEGSDAPSDDDDSDEEQMKIQEQIYQERTYLRYYGLLGQPGTEPGTQMLWGQRFCRIHQENFEKCFVQQYSMIHRLETNKLRNVAKFFAHLLGTDALPWHVLAYIRLTEEDTTSSSRIFIKILFQELSEHLGIRLLNERLTDPTMQDSFESIFPRDNPKNTRFSINLFTSIGLGGITENLREYLKNMHQ